MISEADRSRIAGAIAAAEARTAGEIVCVIARGASDYRSFAIATAALVGLAVPIPLILLTELSAQRIYLVQLLATLATGLLLAPLPVRLRLVPRWLKRRRAREAAQRQFLGRGLAATQERTGVLIFVAACEHYAEIIADEGIAAHVDADVWREVTAGLLDAFIAHRPADGLVAAVERVGAILAEHVPPRPHDRDELPNHVIVI